MLLVLSARLCLSFLCNVIKWIIRFVFSFKFTKLVIYATLTTFYDCISVNLLFYYTSLTFSIPSTHVCCRSWLATGTRHRAVGRLCPASLPGRFTIWDTLNLIWHSILATRIQGSGVRARYKITIPLNKNSRLSLFMINKFRYN